MGDSIEQLTGGYTVYVDGKKYVAEGYAEVNGQNRVIYKNGILYYYFNANHTMEMIGGTQSPTTGSIIKVDGIDCQYKLANFFGEKNDKTFTISDIDRAAISSITESQTVEYFGYSGGQVTGGTTVYINEKAYKIDGYVDLGNGEKRIIYSDPNASLWGNGNRYYVNKNGEFVKANPSVFDSGKYIIDGKSYDFVDCRTNGARGNFNKSQITSFEPSEIDKKFLGGTMNTTEPLTEPPATDYDKDPKYNNPKLYDIKSKLVKRKRFYIQYYQNQVFQKQGPYDAIEGRQLAINTFNMIPGQGKGAEGLTIQFEKNIGYTRYILEEVLELSRDAVKVDGEIQCTNQINKCIEMLNTITPSVFKKFIEKSLEPAINWSNGNQRDKNAARRYEVGNKIKNLTYTFGQQLTNEEMASFQIKIVEEDIIEDVTSKYIGFVDYNEYTKSTPCETSSLPREKGDVYDTKDLYVNFVNTDVIIDDLLIAITKYIQNCNHILYEQVANINKINGYIPAIGMLHADEISDANPINEKVIVLRKELENLMNKYKELKSKANEEDKGSTNHGGGGGWFTATPTSTTTTTTPVTTPVTEAPTETPTERPTVPVTTEPTVTEPVKQGGPLPSTPVNNGGGNNNNGNGGNYYWGNNNYSGGNETPTEAPTTVTTESTFDIKEGNKFKLPTSSPMSTASTTTTTTQKGGSSVIPVLAGLSAAAAAGIGAKAYMDRKKNSDNDEDEFKSEDWSTDSDINIEYQEPTNTEADTLDFDDTGDDYQYEEPEKYDAKTHQELENLQ